MKPEPARAAPLKRDRPKSSQGYSKGDGPPPRLALGAQTLEGQTPNALGQGDRPRARWSGAVRRRAFDVLCVPFIRLVVLHDAGDVVDEGFRATGAPEEMKPNAPPAGTDP